MTPGDLTAGLRRIASRRAARRSAPLPRRGLPPCTAAALPTVEETEPSPDEDLLVRGGRLLDVDGSAVFAVRRDASDLFPELDLETGLREALARITRRGRRDPGAGAGGPGRPPQRPPPPRSAAPGPVFQSWHDLAGGACEVSRPVPRGCCLCSGDAPRAQSVLLMLSICEHDRNPARHHGFRHPVGCMARTDDGRAG